MRCGEVGYRTFFLRWVPRGFFWRCSFICVAVFLCCSFFCAAVFFALQLFLRCAGFLGFPQQQQQQQRRRSFDDDVAELGEVAELAPPQGLP